MSKPLLRWVACHRHYRVLPPRGSSNWVKTGPLKGCYRGQSTRNQDQQNIFRPCADGSVLEFRPVIRFGP